MQLDEGRIETSRVLPREEVSVEVWIAETDEDLDETSRDALQRYFHDVGGHRLLSHEEDIDLSRKVRAGLEVRRGDLRGLANGLH
jgi:hypothetical protein